MLLEHLRQRHRHPVHAALDHAHAEVLDGAGEQPGELGTERVVGGECRVQGARREDGLAHGHVVHPGQAPEHLHPRVHVHGVDDHRRDFLEGCKHRLPRPRIIEDVAVAVTQHQTGRGRLTVRRRDPPARNTFQSFRELGLRRDVIPAIRQPRGERRDLRVSARVVERTALGKDDPRTGSGVQMVRQPRRQAREHRLVQGLAGLGDGPVCARQQVVDLHQTRLVLAAGQSAGHGDHPVVAMGGDVFLGPTARVDGQVVTIGGQLHEEPGSYVGGQRVTAGGLPRGWFPPLFGVLGMVDSGVKAATTIAKMLLILLVAWGFTQLAPRRTQTAFDWFKAEPIKSLGVGLLAWALIIPSIVALALVVAILCITIIGIPLAIGVVLGYVLAIMLLVVWGYVVGAAVLGERLARQLGRSVSSLTMMAVWGIVALTAIKVVGQLFGGIPMGGAPGAMLRVIALVLTGVLLMMAGGLTARRSRRREVAPRRQ